MATSIVIDAGHGGYDNGASYQGRLEKEDTLRLALAVGKRLQEDGYNVIYTRTTDEYQSPFEKAQIGNASGADFFVSLHRNSASEPNLYNGVQTLVYRNAPTTDRLANAINAELEDVGFNNIGIEVRPELAVLRRTRMPAVLVEAGFINSDKDNQIWDTKFDEIANAIADGIIKGISETSTSAQETEERNYGVQTGLFQYYSNADYLKDQLEKKGFFVQIRKSEPYYAVIVGRESQLEQAVNLQKILRREGYDTLIVTV